MLIKSFGLESIAFFPEKNLFLTISHHPVPSLYIKHGNPEGKTNRNYK
jgi:hypothetical protein